MTYSVKDICERFGVTAQTCLKWINSGQLQALNVGVAPGKLKKRYRILPEALAEFERERLVIQPNEKPVVKLKRRSKSSVEFV